MTTLARKMQKTMLRDVQRRRSPRILAIDACKENQQEKKPPVQYFRTRFKRKFDGATDDLTSTSKPTKQVWKGRDNTQDDDNSTKHVKWRSIQIPEIMKENQESDDQRTGKSQFEMPYKHKLELVLDTLQRLDTDEIFAEPVDTDEVEDYKEIIKERMDFGTMRAKLHEGMYQTLEQFEHDVFLIPENAMYFNSSKSDYYTVAQAIHELAQKVFESLKRDPDNFESEFSGTRRRSMRKAWTDVPSKGMLRSQPGSSTLRRASKKNLGCSGMTNRFRSRNSSTGNRDGRLSDFEITGRRSTYVTHGPSSNSETIHVGSPFYSSLQPLVLTNPGEIRYEDSLMSFVKDLGPIAQMVAKRKLSWQHEPNITTQSVKNLVSTTSQRKRNNEDSVKSPSSYRTFSDFASVTSPFLKISNTIDLTKDNVGESSSRHGRLEFGIPAKKNADFGLPTKEIPDFSTPGTQRCENSAMASERTEQCIPSNAKMDNIAQGKKKLDRAITLTKDQEPFVRTRRRSEARRGSRRNKNTFSLKDMANCDQDFRPVILALENPHCNKATENKPRNKKNFAQIPSVETKANEKEVGSSLPPANPPIEASNPVVSQFAFDLPFLKARMSEMSSKRQEGYSSSLRAGGSSSGMSPKERVGFSSLRPGGSLSELRVKRQEGYSSLRAGGSLSGMSPKVREEFPSLRPGGSLSEMKTKGFSSREGGSSGDHHQLKRPLFDQGGSDRSLNCSFSLDINKPYVFGQSFDSLETNLALQL